MFVAELGRVQWRGTPEVGKLGSWEVGMLGFWEVLEFWKDSASRYRRASCVFFIDESTVVFIM